MNDEKEARFIWDNNWGLGELFKGNANVVHKRKVFIAIKDGVLFTKEQHEAHGKAMYEKGREHEINKQLADDVTYELSDQQQKDADAYEEITHLKSRIEELEQRMIDQANMIAKKSNEIAELERSRT